MKPPALPFVTQAISLLGVWLGEPAPAPVAAVRRAPVPSIPSHTLGLDALNGDHAVLLGDGENLSYGLRDRGLDCDYRKMRELLAGRVRRLDAYAFVTTFAPGARRYAERYFATAGWTPQIALAQRVSGAQGVRRQANSDNDILISAGALLVRLRPDVLIIASGDGDLGTAIVRFCHRHMAHTRVFVCSLPNSTSRRLTAAHNPAIAANIWLGADCMGRTDADQETHHDQVA